MLHVDVPESVQVSDEIPTDRRIALRLLWLLDDPHVASDEVTRVISADPALTVRILALANAPYYCKNGPITSLPRAVSLLGPPMVHSIACTAVLHLFAPDLGELPEQFWLHAITTAVAAARVSVHARVDPAEALTVGLLHDYGEHLLRDRDPQLFDDFRQAMTDEPADALLANEKRLFGIDHATLGGRALSSQGLPAAITNAVQQHHQLDSNTPPLAKVVHLADHIAKIVEGNRNVDLDASLRAAGVVAQASDLIDQTETDRRALLKFLAADFLSPRTLSR